MFSPFPSPVVSAPAPRHHRRAADWRSLVFGAVVGSVSTMVGVALVGNTVSDAAPPRYEAPAPTMIAFDAGASAADATPPDAIVRNVLTVDPSEVSRLEGPWPRSRSGSYPYRAMLCIDEHGAVESAALLEGPARLEARIIRALLRWRYRPATIDGHPQPACFELASEVAKMPARSRRRR